MYCIYGGKQLTVFFIFIAVCLVLLLYMRFEAGFLKVKKVLLAKVEANTDLLKVLHISDIHISRLKVPVDRIIETIRTEKPDFIIVTGDYVEKSEQADIFVKFLKKAC